jgi:hypothetical protein
MSDDTTQLQSGISELIGLLDREIVTAWDGAVAVLRSMQTLARDHAQPGAAPLTATDWQQLGNSFGEAIIAIEVRQANLEPVRQVVREIARTFDALTREGTGP